MGAWKLILPKYVGLFFLFLTIRIDCFFQQKIKGLIIGTDHIPLDGATIYIKNTPIGSVTDLPDAHYFIKTYPGVWTNQKQNAGY